MLQKKIRVYFSDTDSQGVVYHAKYLEIAERVRTDIFREKGIDFKLLASKNLYFVVVDAHIQYHSPAFVEDLLQVDLIPIKVGNSSVKFEHKITREASPICTISMTLVFVHSHEGKISPVPLTEDIKSEIKNL